MKVLLSRTDTTYMYRPAFARHRTGAVLLLDLSLRAPSALAVPRPIRDEGVAFPGQAHQLPPFVLPLPGFAPTQLDTRMQRSIQIRGAVSLDLEGMLRSWRGLPLLVHASQPT